MIGNTFRKSRETVGLEKYEDDFCFILRTKNGNSGVIESGVQVSVSWDGRLEHNRTISQSSWSYYFYKRR